MSDSAAIKLVRSWLREPAAGLLAAAALMMAPGCNSTQTREQVFATPAPRELESRLHPEHGAVKAEYPAVPSPGTPAAGTPQVQATYPEDGRIHMSQFAPAGGVQPVGTTDQVTQSANEYTLTQFPQASPSGILKTSFTPAAPRQDACPPSNRMETVAASPLAEFYPDEYLMDGGDRELPVHTRIGELRGLESEDTVAQFSDHTGQKKIKPSNRVAVYSPRFGSIRTVSGLESGTKVDKVLGARDAIGVGNLKTGQKAEASVKEDAIVGLDARNRPDGVETAMPASLSKGTDRPQQNRKADNGQQGVGTFIPNTLQTKETFVIGQTVQNARAWSRNDFPIMNASTTASQDANAYTKVQAQVGVEDERQTKGDLRIVKLADRGTAQIGDTVTFTIEFENVGDFDVYDVRIVDNLTPRLEYIPESASHDPEHAGEITIEPNGEGSQILTFTLDQPLKGHSKGSITFETKVR